MIDPTKIPDEVREKQLEGMLEYLKLGKYQSLSEKEAMAYVRPNVNNPEDRTWLKRNRDQVPHHYVGKSRVYLGMHIAHFRLYGAKAWLLYGGSPPEEASSTPETFSLGPAGSGNALSLPPGIGAGQKVDAQSAYHSAQRIVERLKHG